MFASKTWLDFTLYVLSASPISSVFYTAASIISIDSLVNTIPPRRYAVATECIHHGIMICAQAPNIASVACQA
jgi:hypothetical protein